MKSGVPPPASVISSDETDPVPTSPDSDAVPLNPVAVLFAASSAVSVAANGVPASCGEETVLHVKRATGPGLAVKLPLNAASELPCTSCTEPAANANVCAPI